MGILADSKPALNFPAMGELMPKREPLRRFKVLEFFRRIPENSVEILDPVIFHLDAFLFE